MRLEDLVNKALRLVSKDRQELYGHPIDDFEKTALIWSALFGINIDPWQVPLALIGVKLSRETNAMNEDNIVDIIGYALTLSMVYDKGGRLTKEEEQEIIRAVKESLNGS